MFSLYEFKYGNVNWIPSFILRSNEFPVNSHLKIFNEFWVSLKYNLKKKMYLLLINFRI